jgi:diguanylate cyclase (GGDEF)-like protein
MLERIYRRVAILGVILMAMATCAVGLSLWKQREDAILEATRAAGNLATVIAEQTEHSTHAIDLVLQDVIHLLGAHGATAEGMRGVAGETAIFDMLGEQLKRAPQSFAIGVADANGALVNMTRVWPTPAVNVGDRDYFINQKNAENDALYISEPTHNRVTGEATIFLSRRIQSSDGAFLGVVWIGIHPDDMLRVHDAISSMPGESLVLLRNDGVVYLRHPDERNRAGDRMPHGGGWYRLVADGGGSYRSPGVFDTTARWVAVRLVEHYPLVVNIAVEEHVALAVWRRRAMTLVGGFILLLAGFGVLMRQMLRQIKSAMIAEAELGEREARIQYLAHHDALTGIGNRHEFVEALRRDLSRPESKGRASLVALINIDRFKEINDSYGHSIGNEVLRIFAESLAKITDPGDVVARLGSDEFAFLRPNRGFAEPYWPAIVHRIRVCVEKPVEVAGRKIDIKLSIGVALSGDHASTPGELLRNADLALFRAKSEGRGCSRLFEPSMQHDMLTQRALANDLREAIENEKLEIFYQPIFDSRTLKVRAMEALARWTHPRDGNISPAVFIPLAERFGLVTQLGEYVLGVACRECARWPEDVAVAVNISADHFVQGDLVAQVKSALARAWLEPARLEIEITESAIIKDRQRCGEALRELRELGVNIALDDFGTGYSSLSQICGLPLDTIKIDKSFVDGVAEVGGKAAIISATIHIARAINVRTTAEGVETRQQLALLQAAGVDRIQGYLLGKPNRASAWEFKDGVARLAETKANAA